MLIDEYLPQYDVARRYRTRIAGTPETIYAAARRVDFAGSWIVRTLFAVRSLPALLTRRPGLRRPSVTLNHIAGTGFLVLGENSPEELLIGVVGRFWRMRGNITPVAVERFREFHEPGYAKAAWNFSLRALEPPFSELITETRVFCTDTRSRRLFKAYWFFVGPFSGLIRKIMLSMIRREVEQGAVSAAAGVHA
jgi:hypothetical protein